MEGITASKARVKKQSHQTSAGQPKKGSKGSARSASKAQKTSKRGSKNVAMPSGSHLSGDVPDSLLDSGSTDEYRALRRMYLQVEEENFLLEKELKEAEAANCALEGEKSALLDQLVILEGLMTPSELQQHHKRIASR